MGFCKTALILACLTLSTLVACFPAAPSGGVSAGEGNSSQETIKSAAGTEYKEKDINSGYEEGECVTLTLADGATTAQSGSSVAAGNGLTVNGDIITITESGCYILRGSLSDGQIVVDCAGGTVRLALDGAAVNCSRSSPLYCKNGDIELILAEGSFNSFADPADYTLGGDADEPSACIFAKDDLTVNGGGTLTVIGNFKNGIQSKKNLKITGGSIGVTSVNSGLKGKDVAVSGGIINVDAEGDGIKSDGGAVRLDGGIVTVAAGDDGVQAYGKIILNGGVLNVTAAGDGIASDESVYASGSDVTIKPGGVASKASTVSQKGIKALNGVFISGGTYNVDANDDGLYSDNEIVVAGGDMTVSTGGDGIRAGALLTISDGTIKIKKSYKGLEALKIYIKGGDIDVFASGDGINSADGQAGGSGVISEAYIEITGGDIYLNSSGDGFYSDNKIVMSGGKLTIDGTASGDDGAADYGNAFAMTGGLFIAGGSSVTAMTPSSSSTQYSVSIYTFVNAGNVFELKDNAGNVIVTYIPAKDCGSVVVCCPELKTGTYVYSVGGIPTSFTISSIITTVGSGRR